MKNLAGASLVLLLSWVPSAFAQKEPEGLDLTDETKKKDEPAGLDLSGPATPPPKPKPKPVEKPDERKPLIKKEDEPVGERDITQEDRVKSVQRKLYVKRGRFELAPYFTYNINDPYYSRFGGALRAAFYPADTLAFSARFSLIQTTPTDDVRIAKRNLQSRIFYSVPIWSVMGDVEWSPFYGKAAFANSILHLDGYVLAGGGAVYTETSAAPGRTVSPGFDLGLGLRFVVKDFLAVNVALINTTYVDVPTGTTKGSTQNIMMLHAGVSIFFPFKSTFREAE